MFYCNVLVNYMIWTLVKQIENLEMLLLQAPNQSVRMGDSRILSQMLSQKLRPAKESNPLVRWSEKIKYFILDNWQRLWIMMLWLGICGGLFTYKFIQYKNKAAYGVMGYCVCVAKGGAETLKFNMALILLPVCRNTITWLRNKTKLGTVVPFDDSLNFHKVIASGIVVGVLLHAGAHLTCDFPRLIAADEDTYEPMEKYFGDQPTSYWWFVKGVEGWTGIVMVVLMAIAFTLATPWFRRNKLNLPNFLKKLTGFNAFWYTHHLFIIVYALLIVHGIKLYLTKIWYQKTVLSSNLILSVLISYFLSFFRLITFITCLYDSCRHGCILLYPSFYMHRRGCSVLSDQASNRLR